MTYPRPLDRGFRRALRLTESRTTEPVLAGLLAALVLALIPASGQPWPVLVLDLAACALAGLTARWPGPAATGLALVLAAYPFLPDGWATLGEYSALIPILGAGIRGRARVRATLTVTYFVILAAITWMAAPTVGGSGLS